MTSTSEADERLLSIQPTAGQVAMTLLLRPLRSAAVDRRAMEGFA